MKQYPIGIQNFESLIKDGYYYVDKTRLVYKLITEGRYYFLSRPRRFGKSLLISTIQAFFEGKRELFKGLAIDTLTDDWTPHPVLHIDLNTQKYDRPESLENLLNKALEGWEELYGRDKAEIGLAMRFDGIIKRAHEKTGHRVVILVDEYDKPMLQAIGNEELQHAYRETRRRHTLRHAHGRDEVRQGERLLRPEQPQRHINVGQVLRHLRHKRKRA